MNGFTSTTSNTTCSSSSSSPAPSAAGSIYTSMTATGDYAPSPNTCSQALTRANQLRVQALLRQLLSVHDPQRLDTLRVLRKTLRELDYHLSWLTQVDFLEILERILREENESDTDWRLINDCTQLLIESIPRLNFDVDPQSISQIFVTVVQNLGHQRSEVRRSSLLLINMYLNERPAHFQQILKLFIDYGLANYRNQQAQRGAILSLPLLMTEQVVEGQDLLPLIKCLSELLVDANAQLFYSLYLALQRLHQTVGDQQFAAYLRQCDPEATLLYKQAASRNNSLITATTTAGGCQQLSHRRSSQQQQQQQQISSKQQDEQQQASSVIQQTEPKQVTFEEDSQVQQQAQQQGQIESAAFSSSSDLEGSQLDGQTGGAGGGNVKQRMLDSTSASPSDQSSTGAAGTAGTVGTAGGQASRRRSSNASSVASSSPTRGHLVSDTALPPAEAAAAAAAAAAGKAASVSSTCSSQANLVDPANYMTAAALSGRPLSGYEEIHHVDHSTTGLAINDLGVCCTPTIELGPAAQNEQKFGIFPRHFVNIALSNSARYLDRVEALQEMMCIIRESPINHLAILMTYFDSFLEQFLSRLIKTGQDYKIELIAIDMIETIVIKTKVSTMQYVRPMISLLMKTLGDSRQIFRDNTIRVIHKMMAFLPPQHVIDAIFEHKHSKSALIREESVNRVTAAVLEYSRNEFNLTKLCYHILPMLADHHANVRLASLECIATLANALGQERIGSLLTAAEAVQTGCDYDGLLDAINARLLRRTLPRCNPDGSIRYVIKPFLNLANANFHQEHKAADVRWVLEAPSSHQHVAGIYQYDHLSTTPTNNLTTTTPISPLEQLEHQLVHHHYPHRPGVYSPPELSQRRRRSSLSLCQLTNCAAEGAIDHHHHHHHHHHQQQQQVSGESSRVGRRLSRADAKDSDELALSGPAPGVRADKAAGDYRQASEKQRRSSKQQTAPGEAATNKSETHRRAKGGRNQEEQSASLDSSEAGGRQSGRRQSVQADSSAAAAATQGGSKRKGSSSVGLVRRSNSQDSCSSTDTNKVLFQYYLSKFKQSLTDSGLNGTHQAMNSVLPSDSIIYTDTAQAYALTRHQSRYQQTSFDYDSDSVGRVPGSSAVGPLKTQSSSVAFVGGHATAEIDSCDSTASESPPTVMEAATASTKRTSQQQQQQQVLSSGSDSRRQSIANRASMAAAAQVDQSDSSSRRRSLAGITSKRSSEDVRRPSVSSGARRQQQEAATGDIRHHQRHQSIGGSSQRLPSDEGVDQPLPQPQQQQQKQRPSLTRQSASMFKAPEDDDASAAGSSAHSGSSSAINRQQAEETGKGSLQASQGRQESLSGTTTDSQSSQSQRGDHCSDHATQTSARPSGSSGGGGGGSSRRRRSRHRSSSSRHRQQEQEQDEGAAFSGEQPTTGLTGGLHHETDADAEVTRALIKSSQQQQQERFETRRRTSRSQPPRQMTQTPSKSQLHLSSSGGSSYHHHQQATGFESRRAVSVSPSVASNVNIRQILENIAEVEGPFQEPQLAFKVAISALDGPCWSTKVEGMLALIRLATFHQQIVLTHLHEVVTRLTNETRNLRSTVSRSAIFALGDFSSKLKRSLEPELEIIIQALLQKSIENTAFIRDDIRRALSTMVDNLTQWRLANILINQGAQHKNVHVRRMASQFIALLVERMGAAKCLVGARDISGPLLPAAAKFAQDSSPHTRYYGRLILARIMQHGAFERLLRKNLTPNLYRSTVGIIESVRRRGAGEQPAEI